MRSLAPLLRLTLSNVEVHGGVDQRGEVTPVLGVGNVLSAFAQPIPEHHREVGLARGLGGGLLTHGREDMGMTRTKYVNCSSHRPCVYG